MSEEHMRVPHIEERSTHQAQSRAIVIDATVAKTIVWLAGGAIATCLAVGLWIGVTVQNFDGRISALEKLPPMRDAQISALQSRVSTLEVNITGIGSLKERVDAGFGEITRRLDRMEGDSP